MTLMRGILDRVILVTGVIAAGCVPSFILQYRQRTSGMLDQVLKDLAPFQAIADKLNNGSLKELVRQHGESSDPTLYNQGAAIQTMVESVEKFQRNLSALDTDLFHQLSFLIVKIDPHIARATWETYSPAFALSVESVIFGSIIGMLIWLSFLACWIITARFFNIIMAR